MSQAEEDTYLAHIATINGQNKKLLDLVGRQNGIMTHQMTVLETMIDFAERRRAIGGWVLGCLFFNLVTAVMAIFLRDTLIYYISVGALGIYVIIMVGRTIWLTRKEKKFIKNFQHEEERSAAPLGS